MHLQVHQQPRRRVIPCHVHHCLVNVDHGVTTPPSASLNPGCNHGIVHVAHHFRVLIFGVRIMRSIQYRKIAAECLDRARHAYKSEDVDAWLLIAEDWLRLAIESEAADGQPRGSSQR